MSKKENNQLSPLSLFDKIKEGEVKIGKICLFWINVLPQPRKTFEEIQELAENIAKNGLFNPIGVARFNLVDAERYLSVINKIWKSQFIIENLSPVNNDYYILVDGERRFRAFHYLWENDRDCFQKRFPQEEVPVSILMGFTPEKILNRQFAENTHHQVPPAEEAEAYRNFFSFLRYLNPKYSLTEFSRRVGRGVKTISQALAFCELPELIQAAAKKPVKQGGIPYGIALQLTQLQKAGLDEEDLIWWATRALVSGYKVDKMKQLVDAKLIEMASGQNNLFGIMSAEQESLAKKNLIKKTVEKNIVSEIWAYISYFRTVLGFFENGQLGLETSPFSDKSPRRVYQELINLMHDQLFGHMKKVLNQGAQNAEHVLREAKKIMLQYSKN